MRNYPLTSLNGIGEKRARLFNTANVFTIQDILNYFPRRYIDLTKPTPVSQLVDGELAVIAVRICSEVVTKHVKNIDITVFKVSDSQTDDFTLVSPDSTVRVTLFNRKYFANNLSLGQFLILVGKPIRAGLLYEIKSPTIFLTQESGLRPIYPLNKNLNQSIVYNTFKSLFSKNRKIIEECLEENLPQDIIEKYNLLPRAEAYRKIHFPDCEEDINQAKKRLSFEELFIFQLGLSVIKKKQKNGNAHQITPPKKEEIVSLFPFELTDAQKRVLNECLSDISKPYPMSRLVQGDVGSGKTAIAISLCYAVAKNGFQSCVMVPTEILANQHYNDFISFLSNTDIRIGLLTGSTKASEKKKIKEQLADGTIDILIGTHALIEKDVSFRKLALTITDEQHRFGVNQRGSLSEKAEKGLMPHNLVMSATPIPRSLAMILYGDLSISVIDVMPKGRKKVSTFLLNSADNDRMYNYISSVAKKGLQAYIVCPLVEDTDDPQLKSVLSFYEDLKNKYFADVNIAFVHGKLKSGEKDKILNDFADNSIQVLVSTTVIEVGINVPNAVIMVIQNAERFGLSQLHQLRGRVGRGSEKSYCFLVSDSKSEQSLARLNSFCQINDGFEIAKIDLEQRGPGDFFGVRQSGVPIFRIADILTDMLTAQHALEASTEFTENNPLWYKDDKYLNLKQDVSAFFGRVGNNGIIKV